MKPTRIRHALITALSLGAVLALPAQAANQQSAASFACSGALDLGLGDDFWAMCDGDLSFGADQVLEAVSSITIKATGGMSLFGTLVAPNITLTADTLNLSGGLFSGDPAAFPEVTATSRPGGELLVRDFEDLVPAPIVHPIYGAVISTIGFDARTLPAMGVEPVLIGIWIGGSDYEIGQFLDLEITPIPEPAPYLMLGLGLFTLAARRQSLPRR